MERNVTTINVFKSIKDELNNLKVKWKLKTQNDVIKKLLKEKRK